MICGLWLICLCLSLGFEFGLVFTLLEVVLLLRDCSVGCVCNGLI